MEKQKGEVPRSIVNRLGSISKTDHSNIEVNIIRWNNRKKKLDIRVWSSDGKCPKKGVTFNREEYFQLIRILAGIDPSLIDSAKAEENAPDERPQPVAEQERMHRYLAAAERASAQVAEDDYMDSSAELPEEAEREDTPSEAAS